MSERTVPYRCNNIYYVCFSRPMMLDGDHGSEYYVDKCPKTPDQAEKGRSNIILIRGSVFGQSSFATYTVASERNIVKVDHEVSLALLGPLGCSIQTGAGAVFNALQPQNGSSIAVFGSGPVGLSAIYIADILSTCKR